MHESEKHSDREFLSNEDGREALLATRAFVRASWAKGLWQIGSTLALVAMGLVASAWLGPGWWTPLIALGMTGLYV